MTEFKVPATFAAAYPHLERLRVALRAGATVPELHEIAKAIMVFDTTKAK